MKFSKASVPLRIHVAEGEILDVVHPDGSDCDTGDAEMNYAEALRENFADGVNDSGTSDPMSGAIDKDWHHL